MSTSGYDVMQEKDGDTPVVWTDFVGLCTHLEGVLDRSTVDTVNAHQQLQLKCKAPQILFKLCKLSSLLSSTVLIS
jgi:hypothetical protein